MAIKGAKAGEKRKASSAGGRNTTDKRAKKPRVESTRKPFEGEDAGSDDDDGGDFESFSDAEEGAKVVEKYRPTKVAFKKHEKAQSEDKSSVKVPGQSSREAHIKQRQLAQERKAAKPLADELHRAKKIWERLRRKSHVPKEERQTLVNELFEIITGRMKDFLLKHDSVRAVQTAIKYATPEQRKQIARELQGSYAQLAESRYAKFLIGKLLVQRDTEIRDIIIPEFYGKVRKLINHPEASWILDDIYRGAATKEQKAVMLREWYGPEFVLFKSNDANTTADLSEVLAAEPSKRNTIMKYLLDMTNQLIQKNMTGFTTLHDAMLQYFLNAKRESDEYNEFVEIIKGDESGDLLKNMGFTKSGARLVSLLLAYSNAKDRKMILKAYKDTFQLMCGDPHGHTVILVAYDVIDDTVLTSKAIFPEILGKNEQKEVENVIFCANDPYARTTIRYLFEGTSKSLFPASQSTDLEILKEVHEIRKTTSKKDPEVRRKELIAHLSPQLLAAVAASPNDLVATSFGCQLITDVLLDGVGDKTEALNAIAATAEGSPEGSAGSEEIYPPPMPHISQTPHGGRMFKTLIQGGWFDRELGKVKPVDPPLDFANILYPVIKDHIVSWATGPSSFVVLALLESESFSDKSGLKKTLKKNKEALVKASKEETPEQKAKREAAKEADEKQDAAKGKKKKSAPKQERSVGNQGAKLLLEKL
ncbi:Pumilio y domain family member 6 [Pleurostoma richardsiae]|uniref:Pumilio y domain family member 6 n=1 Tax=Pleurostoma richardsiae TaxID=41990 RepID=A0AA38RTE9_9PEZI|nr:Pumilio y domain family member 6 [Pleurostoma richardsiae]